MEVGETQEKPLRLSFTYTEDEYVAAARYFFTRGTDPKFQFYLGLGFIAGALFITWLVDNIYVTATVMVPLLLVAARYWYVYSALPRSYFRGNPKFRDPYELTFSDEGILFRSNGVESRLAWDFYTKVLETPEYFFLVYGRDMFSLVPKRVLRDRRQASALGEMLRRKFGAKMQTDGMPEASAREIEREYVPPVEPPDWR
jgi:hypothetical protein